MFDTQEVDIPFYFKQSSQRNFWQHTHSIKTENSRNYTVKPK